MTIEERVIALVVRVMRPENLDEVTLESKFVDDLNADSLDTVELAMEAADEFELPSTVQFDEVGVEGLKTVGDLVEFIRRHLGEDPPRQEAAA